MSDPTFWTPPDSPEFVGTGAVFSEDFDVDLLAEIDALRLSLPVFGLSCDSLDSVSFLSHFENATTAPQWTDPLQILNLLRERIVCLKKYPTEYENESAVLRNDVSFLLSCLYSSTITKEFEKHVIVRMVARIRSILVFLGPLSCSLNPEVTGHLLHVHLETWIAVLKVFNFICEKTEYGVLVNETLGLKSRSSLNACGYFVDIVLENLILYSGVANDYKIAIHNSHGNCNKCSCDVFAWIVVIYLIEKAIMFTGKPDIQPFMLVEKGILGVISGLLKSQKNWFKFFHGKMMKLSVHQKADISELNTLERIRPDFKSYFLQSSRSDDRTFIPLCMWSLYWNVLAYTAPVHRLFMEYVTHSKVESGTLQKYSVVVWLIRQQFLGETAPGSSDIHTCLTSLIRLTETWGTNLEVIRSLWLYFKGRLNTGFDTSDSSSSGLVLPNMSFRNWYSKSKSDDEGMQNFILLCSLLRKLPSSDYGELCVILQISLLSLSRNGISYYFYIWANLIEEALNTLKMTTNNNENIQKCVLSMVDSVVVLCAAISQSAGVTQSGVRNWDPSRGCVVLQCLQYLMVICKECWLLHSESDVFCLSKVNCCLLSVVDKINSAIIPLRRALSPLSQVSPADSEYSSIPRSSTFNRLSASSWIAEVTSISTQFLIDLISTHNSAHFPLHSDQVSFIVRCLGSSYFDSFGWSFDVKWNEAILLLIEAVCSLTPCEANLEIFNFIWNVVYSEFRKAVSRSNTKFTPIPVGSLSVLSMISFHFLHVSKICSSFHSNRIVTCQFPDPAEVFELFTMDTSIDFSFHFSILEKCYGTSNAVKELLNILSSSEKSASTIAWLFLITLLTYTLLVKTTIHSFSTEYFDAFILPSFMSEIHPFLPVQTDSTISSIDAELIFLNISSHFDKLSTFHSRMTFKSVFAQHFGRLSEFIWTCCSVSSSAKENGFGLGYLIQTSFMKPEDLCSKGYRAVGMLARYCSMLLYAPVTTEGSASSFENLVNHFILPRQLYEIQDPKKISALNEWNTFPNYVLDSIQEQLPEFSCGVAQLNWRSDPYLCRVLKDFVKLHYKQLGPQAIATVVLNSPSLDFRAHILQLATQDQINHLAENETASFSNSERITSQQNILVRWMKFANAVYADTHSNEGYQRDAPFLVCPILFAYTLKDLTGTLSSDSRKQGARILTVYKEAVESITCKELRSQVYEQCYNLDKKTVDSRCSLITFFGLKNNVS